MGPELITLGAALALWLVGYTVLWRIPLCRAAAQPSAHPAVSIIIPARNEERNLPALLGSIAAQSVRPAEVIVMDDGSTDGTAETARRLGATVIVSRPLPEGWRGKTWACHQGAQAARGELLLFLDADTWFEPDGLARILASYAGGAMSVGPYHAVREPYEQLSAFFNLIMSAGTGAFTIFGGAPRGLFGQMLLVDRESYRRAGGHEAVKGRVLENFWLAKKFRAASIPMRCLAGKGALAFRMYPNGPRELVEGWTKGFASGAGQTALPLLLAVTAWLTGMMMAASLLPFGPWGAPAYLLYAVQLHVLLRGIGAFRWYTALLYPVPLIFFFAVFTRSVLRSGKNVTWKGRTIRAD